MARSSIDSMEIIRKALSAHSAATDPNDPLGSLHGESARQASADTLSFIYEVSNDYERTKTVLIPRRTKASE